MHVDWTELRAHEEVQTLIRVALAEDIGDGDVTTQSVFEGPRAATGWIATRDSTVVCGLPLAQTIFARVDSALDVRLLVDEGELVPAGTALVEIRGDVRAILTGERVVLNFLMRLCGIASAARRAVQAVPSDTRARIYDTRKTTPAWRHLEKAAVRTGGANNHRFGLFDAVLIKDNHIAAAGSVGEAVRRAKETELPVQVEIDGLHQLDEALVAQPDMILLDNFTPADMREAVRRAGDIVELEASGGITLEGIPEVARTGVHRISLGALTHTVQPADLGLDLPRLAPVEHVGNVDSTMLVARERARAGAVHGTTIVAETQSSGRGRRGRSWFSAPGAGLWMTMILRPEREPYHNLGLAAGVAVLEAVRRLGATHAQLKWPNDIVVGERKLAGVLLEADTFSGGREPVVLVGIGLNIARASALELPEDITDIYLGLREAADSSIDVAGALAELLPILQRRFAQWSAHGLARVCHDWNRSDALHGQTVRAEGAHGELRGIAEGIDADGALLMRVGDRVERITTGEVVRVRTA